MTWRNPKQDTDRSVPVVRTGLLGGLVGILCCVGPTVLAVLGLVSGATAYTWANNLYDRGAWWFRGAGLAAMAVVIWTALRKRNQCSVDGVRKVRGRLAAALAIAVATYGALYALTTWLGRFASPK